MLRLTPPAAPVLPPPAWVLAVLWLSLALPAAARCLDEDRVEPGTAAVATAPVAADPRLALQTLVRDALDRSQAVGASKLLAEAAQSDVEEARAARALQASLSAGAGPGAARQQGFNETSAAQLRGSVNLSKLFFDGGRSDRLTDWRTQLAESAHFGFLSQREQIALTAVTVALERSRLRMQTQVYRQNVRKMACLVEALDTIVRADRGRASELVQARKSQQQAELSLSQSQAAARQVDVRLRRLVGDGLPEVEGLSTLFNGVPDLEQLVADVERSSEMAQLDAQVAASGRFAEAVSAGGKPQVSLTANGGGAAGVGGSGGSTRSGSFSVGLQLNMPLYNPALGPASEAARKRARAATLQRSEELESRRFRVAEVHEQALAAQDRIKRLAAVLRESEQVRNFTLQQWQQLGRRSLFDVMGAENEHYSLRVAYINALHDVQQLNANLLSLGRGVSAWLN